MRLLKKICYICLTGLSLGYLSNAEAFVVNAIQIQGLQGVSRETVLNYLPVHVGDEFNSTDSSDAINSLYATGFFSDVSLAQQGNTLVVKVVERPIIANIQVTGNKIIPKDKIDEVLKNIGLVQGHVFDSSTLARLVHSLQSEYAAQGKYNARITPTVTPEPRNRVAIKIDISEGRSVVVKDIQVIGNTAFSNSTLVRQMSLTTPRPWSFFTHSDQFTQDKLDDSLEALRSYYLDRGYLRFKIDSVQATLTPDKNAVYIVIHVTEGPIYTIKGYQLAGNLIIPATKLQSYITIKPGSVFSKKEIQNTTDTITALLGNMGYLFATVNTSPDVDEKTRQVFLTFYVDPGTRTYIRRINFIGNTKTEDVVLRRELTQMEGGLASQGDIKESDRLLNLTGYLDSEHSNTVPVPGVPDQVDLNYNITESPSASATAGVGYGTQGWVVNAGLNQTNFLGTGNSMGLNFSTSRYSTVYSLNYTNPYYTQDGVQRSISVYDQRTTPGNVNIADYTTDIWGGTVNYSIPFSSHGDNLQLGYGYQNLLLDIGSTPSTQLLNFVNSYGRHFNIGLLNGGWTRNGLDKAIFPTSGLYQNAGLQVAFPVSSDSVEYYKANYNVELYQPIVSQFIFTARGNLGYGAGLGDTHGLPFFANYYAGGILPVMGTVRGFEENSLGPRDSDDNPLGGNELVAGSAAIIFPNPVGEDRLRTLAFVDGGNVYSSKAAVFGGTGAGPIRYTAGLAADFRVPVMNVLMQVDFAEPLNAQPGDERRIFDFNVGTNL
jgi:outer membrane protein insertion porin family